MQDSAAFVRLVDPLLPMAYRLAYGMLRSQMDAEDALQDALMNAWRNFHRFRPDADLKPWLLKIVANQCRSHLRNGWQRVVKVPEFGSEGATDPAGGADPDVRRALYRLPHDQRLSLVLRFYLDLSFEEVGKTLGISPKAAKSRTYRALDKLRLLPELLNSD